MANGMIEMNVMKLFACYAWCLLKLNYCRQIYHSKRKKKHEIIWNVKTNSSERQKNRCQFM